MDRVGAHPDAPPLYVCWTEGCEHRAQRRTIGEIESKWPGGEIDGMPLANAANRAYAEQMHRSGR